jgi:hypothetical protein
MSRLDLLFRTGHLAEIRCKRQTNIFCQSHLQKSSHSVWAIAAMKVLKSRIANSARTITDFNGFVHKVLNYNFLIDAHHPSLFELSTRPANYPFKRTMAVLFAVMTSHPFHRANPISVTLRTH